MRRLIRRAIAVAVVSIAISMFVSAVPAAQAVPVNCVHRTHQGACYGWRPRSGGKVGRA
jgi:hypothetical protein